MVQDALAQVRKETFNRTLWNWNKSMYLIVAYHKNLLIVPYGIETYQKAIKMESGSSLLIVPYGIETTFIVQSVLYN